MPNISFHTQVVLVCLESFLRNSLLKCVLQPESVKKSLKPLFWGFKVVQGHRCWYHRKARQQCGMISSKSMSICNHFHARRAVRLLGTARSRRRCCCLAWKFTQRLPMNECAAVNYVCLDETDYVKV